MNVVKIVINGTEYELNTTLRAAKAIQTSFGHKPYTELFKNFGSMSIEDQVKMLYAPFNLANPGVFTQQKFEDAIIDSWGIMEIMEAILDLSDAITSGGLSPEEVEEKKSRMAARAATREA